jgi:hypothetical protein
MSFRFLALGYRLDRGVDVRATSGKGVVMATILFIIAAVLVIAGIVSLVRGEILWGIVLIVIGLLVGPGGVSIFA